MPVVSVIGMGAMGASYAARIATQAPDAQLRVVADGSRAERLRRDGIVVNGVHHRFHVVDPAEPAEPADLVVVAVKCHHLSATMPALRGHVGPGTAILSLQNGITSEDVISEAYPQAYVPLAVAVGIDAVRDEAGVRTSTMGWVDLGDRVPGEPSARAHELEALLGSLGLACAVRPDMLHALWWKFLVNTGVNQVSALLEAPYAPFQDDGPARDLLISAQREVIAVANAEGVDLTYADVESFLSVLATLGPDNYTSMAQDALAHRFTEVDQFAGKVVSLGARHGVPTPVNEVLLSAFHAKHRLWGVA